MMATFHGLGPPAWEWRVMVLRLAIFSDGLLLGSWSWSCGWFELMVCVMMVKLGASVLKSWDKVN